MDLNRIAISVSDPERRTTPSPYAPPKNRIDELDQFWKEESKIDSSALSSVIENFGSRTQMLLAIADLQKNLGDEIGSNMIKNFAKKFAIHELSINDE